MRRFVSLACLLVLAAPAYGDDANNLCFLAPDPDPANVVSAADDALHGTPEEGYPPYEQWYWAMNLSDLAGRKYSAILAFQQFSFGANTIRAGIVSLTDQERDLFQHDFTLDFGSVFPTVPGGYDLQLASPTSGLSVSAKGGGGSDDLSWHFPDGTTLTLGLEGTKIPTPGFDHGFLSYADPVTGESHGEQYYINRRQMAAFGTLTFPGQPPQFVAGFGWFDRQYGSVIGTPGTEAENVKWTWMAIHVWEAAKPLAVSEYMVWHMKALDTGHDLVHEINKVGPAPFCKQSRSFDFAILEDGPTVTRDGVSFRLLHQLEIPAEGLSLTLTPLVSNPIYSNPGLFYPTFGAAVEITGTRNGKAVKGVGYIEKTTSCCQVVSN
jgi:hypothetical protein